MEPEHLRADGARLGGRRAWVVLAVVLVVVVGLVVLRLQRTGPDTSPAPVPTPAATSPGTIPATPAGTDAWPTDLPPGTLYVGAEGWVRTVDTRGGRLTSTHVPAAPGESSMTPLAGGVLVWGAGRVPTVLVDPTSRPAGGALRTADAYLPGPDGAVWAMVRPADRPARTTWRRVDVDGRATASVLVEGTAESDGSGGVLSVTGQGSRPVYPRSRAPRRAGDVIATGPGGYVRRSCVENECRFTLHHRHGEPDTELTTAVGEDTSGGTLSPTNRFLAVTETVGGTATLRVSVVGTGQIKDIFPAPKGTTSDAAWLDDRWLALISEDRLTLYDAVDERVVTPALPLSSVGPLAWQPA